METVNIWPPQYCIRRSQRAQSIRLSIHPAKGLELVLPIYKSEKEGLAFLNSKRAWIEKYADLLEPANIAFEAARYELPYTLELKLLASHWDVRYHHRPDLTKVKLCEMDKSLIFSGKIKDFRCCLDPARKWIKKKAKYFLPQLLQKLSQTCQLSYKQLSFRNQKTLWGSCSAKNNISLNAKLMFLPEDMVQYVLIHELCHTVHLNHSKRFWNLVSRFEPNYKSLRGELRKADQYVPKWWGG